ncbi:MAG: S8 family serine peptidase, partial [Bacteroidota bacterium]
MEKVLEKTQRADLQRLASIYAQDYQENYNLALKRSLEINAPLFIELSDGNIALLDGIDERGKLVYIKTENNTEAAQTTGADQIQPGGELGLYLTGRGLTVGVWEVGSPNLDHQEFVGRISQRDGGNNIASAANHATHVNGTVGAQGVNPVARGMANEVFLHSYTAENDENEMAAAAANGLLISNHSYGIVRGWNDNTWEGNPSISTEEDYLFGFYERQAFDWDQIAHSAPYYLIVKSAGNERNDTGNEAGITTNDGNDGTGYDCIAHGSIAKNVLTVGAVRAVPEYNGPGSVIMSSFSSWGPADDGRIKPDLVAQGVGVRSSGGSQNNTYSTLQGTSMSSPNAAGSLLLIQQLSRDLFGEFLWSSTLKGLAIHTCLEAGDDPGPDYRFGWGLLNVAQAANVLSNKNKEEHHLEELTLNPLDTIRRTIQSDGNNPLIATICWNDPPGNQPSPMLDPRDIMLIHDIDLRVFGPDGTEYFPWTLDPTLPTEARPDAPAQKADNFRDNVEKIEILDPMPGEYTIRITHKPERLPISQDVALIASAGSLVSERQTFYWIGDSGDWNDPSHWSLTSGGPSAGTVPGISDHVIFDAESFTDINQVVNLTENAACHTFGWYAENIAQIQFNQNEIQVEGSFYQGEETLEFADSALFKLTGIDSHNSQIVLN